MILLLIPCFIAVSGKLFLSPPMIFAFSPSNSPLQLLQEDWEGKEGGSERACIWFGVFSHDLECFGESTKLGITIPKPCQ